MEYYCVIVDAHWIGAVIQRSPPGKCESILIEQPRIDAAGFFLTKETPLDDKMHALLEIVGQVAFQVLQGHLQRGQVTSDFEASDWLMSQVLSLSNFVVKRTHFSFLTQRLVISSRC